MSKCSEMFHRKRRCNCPKCRQYCKRRNIIFLRIRGETSCQL